MMSATVRATLIASLCAACLPSTIASEAVRSSPNHAHETPHEVGIAAWYGEPFHGGRTASGEIFDMYDLTAAHRQLPFGSLVQVTNLKNKRSVVVRINDRGPWQGHNRIIDLSYAASQALGMSESGVALVRLDLVTATEAATD